MITIIYVQGVPLGFKQNDVSRSIGDNQIVFFYSRIVKGNSLDITVLLKKLKGKLLFYNFFEIRR